MPPRFLREEGSSLIPNLTQPPTASSSTLCPPDTGPAEVRRAQGPGGRRLRARHVPDRRPLGPRHHEARRGTAQGPPRGRAPRLAETGQATRAARPLPLSALHHLRALRHPQDHRPLDQLRAVRVAGDRAAARPLGQTGRRSAVPARRLS